MPIGPPERRDMIGGMAGPVSIVDQIRGGVSLVAAEGTAKMRFFPSRMTGPSFENLLAAHASASTVAAFSAAKRVLKRGLSVLPAAPPPVEYTGVIDFAQERSIYNCGTFWKLIAPGRDYVGEPGAWEADKHDGIARDEPFWLLELLKATVAAVDAGIDMIDGVQCRHYRGSAKFALTAATAARALAAPAGSDELDLDALAIEAWLDTAGRIRRGAFHGAGTLTLLDLYAFGEPDPINLPGPSEILPDEE